MRRRAARVLVILATAFLGGFAGWYVFRPAYSVRLPVPDPCEVTLCSYL